jgi:hypothetical protein
MFGLGRHEWDLNLSKIIELNKEIVKVRHCRVHPRDAYGVLAYTSKILLVCQVLYATAITSTKLSIIATYLRVLPNRKLHRLLYCTGALILGLWVCSVFVTIFQCNPVRGAWDFDLEGSRCIHIQTYFYIASGFNIATDLVLCIAPIPIFWKLKISQKERIILSVLFGVGLL